MNIFDYLKHWMIGITNAVIRFPIFIWSWLTAKPVPLETAQKRLLTCYDCDEFDLLLGQCQKCWCFMRRKVQWHNSKCPLDKWLD